MGGKDTSNAGYDPGGLGSKIGSRLTSYLDKPAPFWDASLYPGMNPMEKFGLDTARQTAWDTHLTGGFQRAFDQMDWLGQKFGMTDPMRQNVDAVGNIASQYGDIAANAGTGNPAYQTLRNKLTDDVTTNNLSAFNASGMFGSDSNQESLAEGLGTALAGADMEQMRYGDAQRLGALDRQMGAYGQRFGMEQQAVDNMFGAGDRLGSRFRDMMMPGEAIADIGSRFTADETAKRQGDFDWFNRKYGADDDRLFRALNAFTGSQNNPGMGEEVPWWQQWLGFGMNTVGRMFNPLSGQQQVPGSETVTDPRIAALIGQRQG